MQASVMGGWGCVGLCCVGMNCQKNKGFPLINGKPAAFNPDTQKGVTCFTGPKAEEAAKKVECPKGTTQFIFSKQGIATADLPKEGEAKPSQIRAIDGMGDFNYVSFSGGYYWGMDHAQPTGNAPPPSIIICKKPPTYDKYPDKIWCSYCKPCSKE